MDKIKKAYEYIDKSREDIKNDLFSLCRIPSISVSNDENFPFGENVESALREAQRLFAKQGFNLDVKTDKGYAICDIPGKGDGIGIFGHADVVPVNDDWTKTSPFEPVCEDGILYARGISDNKAGVISSLYALSALKNAGIDVKSRICVYVGGSEETGMDDIGAFVENEKMPAVSVIPDSDFPVSIGEKGIIHAWLKAKKPFDSIHEFSGGKAFNVVLDSVLVNGEQTRGLTSHAAHPEGSENAAIKASKALLENESISQNDKEILSSFAYLMDGYYGENFGIASQGVFGKTTCVNGMVKIEDGHFCFSIDIRYGSEANGKDIYNALCENAEKHGFEFSHYTDDPGFLLDENGKEMQVILSALREFSGQKDAMPYKTYGGTYARKLRNAYAIDHSMPFDRKALGLPSGHGGAHQSDEALPLDCLIDGIKALSLIIRDLDEHLTK